MKRTRCHDCHVKEGELHHFNCDMERCPFCGNQLITCGCYSELANEDGEKFFRVVKAKGRIPWVQIPNLCRLCGEQWPEMFSVPSEEWKKYIIPALQDKMLCWLCYDRMKALFPNGWQKATEEKRCEIRQTRICIESTGEII